MALTRRNATEQPTTGVIRRRSVTPQTPAEVGGGLYFAAERTHMDFVRSGCTMLDCVLGGGWVAGKVGNTVGDKSTGKTQLAMEMMACLFRFYDKAAECYYDEPEAAFDDPYARRLAIPIDRVIQLAREEKYVRSIEAWGVRVEKIIERRLKSGVKTPGVHITDSLDALSDEPELQRELTDESYGGRKAAKLAEFFRKNIDGLRESNLHLQIISQIRDVMDAKSFGKKTKRSGGHALDFYASQVLWLTHIKRVTRQVRNITRCTGIEVKAMCEKSKVCSPFRDAQYELTFMYGIEDEKASREFLDSLKPKVPHADLQGEALRAVVMREWNEIEASFLSRPPKYAE